MGGKGIRPVRRQNEEEERRISEQTIHYTLIIHAQLLSSPQTSMEDWLRVWGAIAEVFQCSS